MKHDIFLKKYLTFVFAAILLFTTAVTVLPVNGEAEIYDKILRLHIVANSDTDLDQSLKLKVRDSILNTLAQLYAENDVKTKEQAEALINNSLGILKSSAERTVSESGSVYEVQALLCKEYYPTRKYQNVTLPAGEYTSLQIKLGQAEGKNWWCVLFPKLCLSPAAVYDTPNTYIYSENGEEFISAGFTSAELRIITESDSPDVKIKFKVLELFEGGLF